ncbi:hypothetical protein PAMA_002673 [Pampus argenteus]
MSACVPVEEKSPKSSNEDGKYGTVLFSPGWTGTIISMDQRALLVHQIFGLGKVMDPETSPSCLLLGQQSISQPRPACLQGLRPAFIPCSAAKDDTPPGHEERGMHSHPPPSSLLSIQRSRDGGPFMETNQDPRHQIPLFFIRLFASSPSALFSPLCASVVCSGREHSAAQPQPCRGLRRAWPGPLIRAALGCCEGHESTNITPLSKRTLGPTAEHLCYCGSHAAGEGSVSRTRALVVAACDAATDPDRVPLVWNILPLCLLLRCLAATQRFYQDSFSTSTSTHICLVLPSEPHLRPSTLFQTPRRSYLSS